MAGKLIHILTAEISSPTAYLDIGGANWDSSYDTYMLVVNGITNQSNDQSNLMYLLDSSNNAITGSDYKFVNRIFFGQTATSIGGANGFSYIPLTNNRMGTGDTYSTNAIMYLYSFNNASEPSYLTYEQVNRRLTNTELQGLQGGGFLIASQHKGVRILASAGNLASGKATLFGVK